MCTRNREQGASSPSVMPVTSSRVLIGLPCLLRGGTEMHTLALARSLAECGFSVVVCVYYEHEPNMVQAAETAGARVRLFGLTRPAGRRNVLGLPRLARALGRVIRDERPDYVHIQYMAPGLVPLMVAKLLRVPRVFATVHVPASVYGRRVRTVRMAARLCDAFVCVSETAERSFFGTSALLDRSVLADGRRHFTIHNAVDLEKIDELLDAGRLRARREELGLSGCRVIGINGRLSPEKGQRWLWDAMALVVERFPSARLLVVGDGAEREALVARAEALGIAPHIVWLGSLSHEESLFAYGLMDIVAVPSLWEGFGLSAAEAMAAAKPVVASDVDGLREVVDDGVSGLRVPCGDARRMAEAILRLLSNPADAVALGRRAREGVESRFSSRCFTERVRLLYDGYRSGQACNVAALSGTDAERCGTAPSPDRGC